MHMTIKGTARNKDRARVWVESDKLAGFGFARHAPITIYMHSDRIVVELDPEGKRKVAGRERGNRRISILDICFPAAQRDEMFNHADKLAVQVEQGRIVIKAA